MDNYFDKAVETSEQRINRIVSIGYKNLLDWWRYEKSRSYPATFGHSGTEFASSVAYMLDNGGPSQWQLSNPDIWGDTIEAYRQIKLSML